MTAEISKKWKEQKTSFDIVYNVLHFPVDSECQSDTLTTQSCTMTLWQSIRDYATQVIHFIDSSQTS